MPDIQAVNPPALGKPLGHYSQIMRVKASELLFIAGQVATGTDGHVIAGDFDAQCGLVYTKIETALKAAGAGWANVVQFTTYLINSHDIARFRDFRMREYPRFFPTGAYPPNTLLIINRLADEGLLLEVQTIAAL